MSAKIQSLRGEPLPGESEPELIELLEGALRRAKEGTLRGVAVALLLEADAGWLNTSWSAQHGNALLGMVRRLEHEVLIRMGDIDS